ncbi:hypothetical protein [Erinnyis ello granulovirus]|uniref:Uncharacterized protein n=1 Tax=Erinnyis ello granulovirus TaxID=307444 RepID=A0A097DAJ4_9BBAC|nr:hypothetical protein [Erinnyis ello granulovirus]AIS92012.1 hypothetical protein [Erinnyis ello granulovirus]ARX71351.1 hypothetical protein EREL_012 [Erinnyis ello granulovirus]ARX71481.1 hypothetical protein EREL_012 [Erinnyis ello granulovirus]ARX71611.1 hypothetical protein EREL_012 [Erinnyis ello granulovirus]ARX71741.1 hypothetical protein EREL_012 [Erinnyis ello granulovirus]
MFCFKNIRLEYLSCPNSSTYNMGSSVFLIISCTTSIGKVGSFSTNGPLFTTK